MPRIEPEPSSAPHRQFDVLACAALRGDKPRWSLRDDPETIEAFLGRVTGHGVQVLLHAKAAHLDWPRSVLDHLRRQALGWAAWEARHREHVYRVLAALASRDIPVVIFKGTALALTCYASPHLRPRADTDLMVPASRRAGCAEVLRGIGLRQEGSVESEFVSYEASFRCAEPSGSHTFDLHWRIHYSQMQAQLLPFEELYGASAPIAALDGQGRLPSRAHCVLITCIHRANDLHFPLWHGGKAHFGADRLIWLHDLHLLLEAMSEEEAAHLTRIATAKGLWPVCADALLLTAEAFGTRLPAPIESLLGTDAARDPLRAYHHASTLMQKWTDVRALPGWRERARFTFDHLLPPPGYMRGRYRNDDAPLRVLHARRIVDALRRRSSVPQP